jgi:signal transduction histidine kinase
MMPLPPEDRRGQWLVWRRRGLILFALLGCLGVFGVVQWMAGLPYLDAQWQRGPAGQLVLVSSNQPALQAQRGHAVLAMRAPGGPSQVMDAQLLHRAPRWQAHEPSRQAQRQQLQGIHTVLVAAGAAQRVELLLDTGQWVSTVVAPRGYAGLGMALWPLVGLALLLYLFAAILLWAKSQPRHSQLVVMSICQVLNLLFLALETLPGLVLSSHTGSADGLSWTTAAMGWAGDTRLRVALDLCSAAASVHAFAVHPRPLPGAKWLTLAGFGVLPLWLLLTHGVTSPSLWWWGQAACMGVSAMGLVAVQRSLHIEANPYSRLLRRFALTGLLTFAAATVAATAVAVVSAWMPLQAGVALTASITWNALVTIVLLIIPFSARSPQLFREFATLAGISTLATSIDLLFVAVFALSPFTSLAAAVFIALALYAALRQRMMNRLIGNRTLTTERTFDHIYRAARAVQEQPTQYTQRLTQLLRDIFEPVEVLRSDRVPSTSLVIGGGSTLVVPIRSTEADSNAVATPPAAFALGLRFAQKGQRLFNLDDARLADRAVEQLRRAVAYDQAVEQGRHEERLRIAQDLHDDIGARLLTLMYQSTNPEMEDYIRHTLQDLKTLTRGLAAQDHLLSHAAAEWKADLTQRLHAAQGRLAWSFDVDNDLSLTMGQWSALTRVLRELVSNSLYHGHASLVEVDFQLQGSLLQLSVRDNGGGKNPQDWAHGLGMGGVRKRVKALGGQVLWRENTPVGVCCEVTVADFGPREQGVAAGASGFQRDP